MTINIEKLKDSRRFTQLMLEQMDAAIFIADETLTIYEFNEGFTALFGSGNTGKKQRKFGLTAGCEHALKAKTSCGETGFCGKCQIRKTLEDCLSQDTVSRKKSLTRVFYIDDRPVEKKLEFTCQPIVYDEKKLFIIFAYDVTRIERSRAALKEKQRQIEIDLEKAGQIQQSLLPDKRPDLPGVSVDWFFKPSFKVGGDVFHIYEENERLISSYMVDVSGHGVSAALVAVMVKQVLDQLHIHGLKEGAPYSPGRIIELLEEEFPFERFDCYLTIVSTLLDIRTGRLLYFNAGHVPPVIVRHNGTIDVLQEHGTIIGLGRNKDYAQQDVLLNPGDKIILYTDGLVDYFGNKGDVSNINRFYQTLEAHSSSSAEKIVEKIVAQRILKGGRAPADDISLLALEYTGYQKIKGASPQTK